MDPLIALAQVDLHRPMNMRQNWPNTASSIWPRWTLMDQSWFAVQVDDKTIVMVVDGGEDNTKSGGGEDKVLRMEGVAKFNT